MAQETTVAEADVLLVGGGLAASLIALRLKSRRPGLRVIILEREARIGGEHTWCHFEGDVSADASNWLKPLIAHAWSGYDVRFPAFERTLGASYRAITARRLHQVMTERLGDDAWLGVDARDVGAASVRLVDGRRLAAPLVIDARGPRRSEHMVLAWQKFLGREVRLAHPHRLERPVVMDATVAQLDGYRFIYLLPLAPDRLLIEDTRYADAPALDRAQVSADIDAYAAAHGWRIAEEIRQEVGVLPIALAGDIDAYWGEAAGEAADAGMRAALYNPTTGYSFPDAVRQADLIAALPTLATAPARAAIEAMSKAAWRRRGFYRMLNRMLFRAARPAERWRIFARFYRLPEPLIERFYPGEATGADKARILAGRPPVPIGRALATLSEARLLSEHRTPA